MGRKPVSVLVSVRVREWVSGVQSGGDVFSKKELQRRAADDAMSDGGDWGDDLKPDMH